MCPSQRTGMRMALKPASFTALIIASVVAGLPQQVSHLLRSGCHTSYQAQSLLSQLPPALSSELPRFQPAFTLLHHVCASIVIPVSSGSAAANIGITDASIIAAKER